jgi:hypothetical protein
MGMGPKHRKDTKLPLMTEAGSIFIKGLARGSTATPLHRMAQAAALLRNKGPVPQSGELPGIKLGKTWIILRDEIKDYLTSKHNQAGHIEDDQESAQNTE